MFRHLHEIQSGRTSSISHEILGFDSAGNSVDYASQGTAENICENSSKLITFIDLAGHQKYLRTTISALTGYCPHYVMLVISATAGVVGMTQEHLGIAVALEVPFFVVITKVDMVPPARLTQTVTTVTGILKSAGASKVNFDGDVTKVRSDTRLGNPLFAFSSPLQGPSSDHYIPVLCQVPLVVKTSDDCITAASNSLSNNVVPIFIVSSVAGSGLGDVKQFLHLLPPGVGAGEASKLDQELPEFQIDELFEVPGVGTVAGGLVTQGIIVENMALKVGPFEDGTFRLVQVSSIRRNKAACRLVRAQQSAALALGIPLCQLRRGMVATSPQGEQPQACQYFQVSLLSVAF